jgi:hypothetical protein
MFPASRVSPQESRSQRAKDFPVSLERESLNFGNDTLLMFRCLALPLQHPPPPAALACQLHPSPMATGLQPVLAPPLDLLAPQIAAILVPPL